MRTCKRCGAQLSSGRFCTRCGWKADGGSKFVLVAVLVVVVVAIFSFLVRKEDSSAPTVTIQTDKPTGIAATPEGNYLGAATSYLHSAYDQGNKLAHTMAGASDGSSTLSDIKDALKKAKFVESMGYTGDYQNRIKGNVPPRYQSLADDIDETHRLFQASTKEMLLYWEDQNVAHIESGQRSLKRCVLLMNDSVKQLRKEMATLAKEQGTSKKPS
jgi:hypothetical protein